MHTFTMFLPKPDGTKQVFCENYTRKHRPCDGRVTLDQDGNALVGYVIYAHASRYPVAICSETCLAAYARRKN